jgi:hypothetical protein
VRRARERAPARNGSGGLGDIDVPEFIPRK